MYNRPPRMTFSFSEIHDRVTMYAVVNIVARVSTILTNAHKSQLQSPITNQNFLEISPGSTTANHRNGPYNQVVELFIYLF